VRRRRGRRSKQLMDGLTLKTERQTLDRTLWKSRFGRCYGSVVTDYGMMMMMMMIQYRITTVRFLHRSVPLSGLHNQLTLLCRVFISLIVTIKKRCASYTGRIILVSNVSENSSVGLIVN
jgi:hypothetical protein